MGPRRGGGAGRDKGDKGWGGGGVAEQGGVRWDWGWVVGGGGDQIQVRACH